MNKSNLSVVVLLISALLFVGLSIAMAVSIVSTPTTVQVIAPVTPATASAVLSNTDSSSAGAASQVAALLAVGQDDKQSAEQKIQAIDQLSAMTGGDSVKGKETFKKHCAVCHKVAGEGADHAPDLTEVATRLTRQKIVESILQPSAVVEEKYKTTMIATLDGEVFTGLLLENKEGKIKLFDGKQTREVNEEDIDIMETKESSSMPTKLADALAEGEFISLVEYLAGLKKAQ